MIPQVKERVIIEEPMANHKSCLLGLVLNAIIDENHGAIKSMDEIEQ